MKRILATLKKIIQRRRDAEIVKTRLRHYLDLIEAHR